MDINETRKYRLCTEVYLAGTRSGKVENFIVQAYRRETTAVMATAWARCVPGLTVQMWPL